MTQPTGFLPASGEAQAGNAEAPARGVLALPGHTSRILALRL
jgi:hypothetical protein